MDTVLWARSEDSAARARDAVDGAATVVTELDALGDRTVVVEAVAEDAKVKTDVLGGLGVLLPAEALVATTTSSLSVGELGDASARPDRFAALHLFNPVEKMKLVELAFPDAATPATRASFRRLCETLGKTAGKDQAQDKPTYVSILGLDESQALARQLAQRARRALEPFGSRASRLAELADFIVHRVH